MPPKQPPDADAIPRRYRDKLVPPHAVGVPEPIVKASEGLRVSGLAAEAATVRRANADGEDRVAKKFDSDAAIEAVRRAEDPPPATAPAKRVEYDTAIAAEQAAKEIARRAEIALERAIQQHRDRWIRAQRDHAAGLVAEVLAQVDELEAAIDRLTESANVVKTLQEDRPGTIDQSRTFRRGVLGAGLVGKSNPVTAPLAELRETIAAAVPPPLPAPEEVAAQEREAEARQRRARNMIEGAAIVGPGRE
jgi:hypothetical protein